MSRIAEIRSQEEALFYQANFKQTLAVSIAIVIPACTFMVVCLAQHLIYGRIDAAEVRVLQILASLTNLT
jgi:hypothetical protein